MKWWLVIFLVLLFAVILIVLFTPRGNYEVLGLPFVLSQLGYGKTNKNIDREENIDKGKEETEPEPEEEKEKEEAESEPEEESEPESPEEKETKHLSPEKKLDSPVLEIKEIKNLSPKLDNVEAHSRINDLLDVEEVMEEWREMQKKRKDEGKPKMRLSMAQYICQRTFETIFALPFPEMKPEFLTNPETFDPIYPERSRLELDGFNQELMVAFEYNGEQHYEYNDRIRNHFKMSKRDFVQQCRRDIFKKEVCRLMGIVLLVIPFKYEGKKLKYEDIPMWIAMHLDRKLDKYRHDLVYI